jgi:NAD(P)H-flavin reductase
MPNFLTATLTRHVILATKFHELTFQTPQAFIFEAGQFISVRINPQKINSYSLSAKLEDNRFLLLVDTAPGGLGSQYIENLKVGDQISFLGPFGKFILHLEDPVEHLIFVGTGCGISPLRALIDSALEDKKCQLPLTLYFGLRYPSDVFWQDHFQKLAQAHPNFAPKICLSRPDPAWTGASGHVTDNIKNDFPDAKNIAAYLCGNPQMTAETIDILKSLHCPENHIYSEKF